MQRVLMVGWEYPPYNSGGLGVACQRLSEAVARERAHVTFALPWRMQVQSSSLSFLFADDRSQMSVEEFLVRYRAYRCFSPPGRLAFSEDEEFPAELPSELIAAVFQYADTLVKRVHGLPSHIIHAHDWLTFPAAFAVHRATGWPLVTHFHSLEYDRSGGVSGGNELCRTLESAGVHGATASIAVSAYTKRVAIAEYAADPTRVTVVHNGTDVPLGSPPSLSIPYLEQKKAEGFRVVLFVGRFTIQKGADTFLKAAARACAYDEKLLIVMAGSGELLPELVTLSAQLGIADRVLFAGFVRGEELRALYQRADLFVMSSLSEPFGLTALEAVVHDTPVIVSKQSGVAEVLRSAITVDCWDVDELANKMVSVLRYAPLSRHMRERSLQEALANTWHKAAHRCAAVYERVHSAQGAFV